MSEWIRVEEAEAKLKQLAPSFGTKRIKLTEATHDVLAEPIYSDRNQPPFHRVAMDGIAICQESFSDSNRSFEIEGTQKAGAPQLSLSHHHHCIEVMTGAMLPVGASAVLPVEWISIEGGVAVVEKGHSVEHFQNVHPEASDCRAGELIVEKGLRLTPPRIAVAASMGYSSVLVNELPAILIVSTGDELIDIDQKPLPYQIRRSNPAAIEGCLKAFGFQNIKKLHLKDDPSQLEELLSIELGKTDILIFTGGVSMGKFDFLPEIFEKKGIKKIFHKVNQRPGKPLWFGAFENKSFVFGLPGNPVSALTCLRRYVIPFLSPSVLPRKVKLLDPITFRKTMTLFQPVRLDLVGSVVGAKKIQTNGSGDYCTLSQSDGFIEFAADHTEFQPGIEVPYFGWCE